MSVLSDTGLLSGQFNKTKLTDSSCVMRGGKAELQYGFFWDEFKSIEQSSIHTSDEDISKEDPDVDARWLFDAGFPSIVDKYIDNKEVNINDDDLIAITESLTHTQAAAVRKRIESLNETVRKKKLSQKAGKHVDVRDLFPTQTEAESSDSNFYSTAQARSQPIYEPHQRFHADNEKKLSRPYSTEDDQRALESVSDRLRNARTSEPIFFGAAGTEIPLQIQRKNSPGANTGANTGAKIGKAASESNWRGGNQPYPPPRRSISEGVELLVVRKKKGEESIFPESQTSGALLSPVASQKLGYGKKQNESEGLPRKQERSASPRRELRGMQSSPTILCRRHSSYSKETIDAEESLINNGVYDEKGVATTERNTKAVKNHNADAKLSIGSSGTKYSTCPSFGGDTSFLPLPNFTLTRDPLGMTKVEDLSEADLVKVRSLALIELTALLDSYNISMNRRKSLPKMKQKETGVFGVPLSVLAQKDEKIKCSECKAPNFVQEILSFLEVNGLKQEGLLRVTGSAQRIKQMREEIEERYCDAGFFSWNDRRASDVANLLKQFLRELPTPLVTREYQNSFAAVVDLPDRKLQLQALNLLILLLPSVHRDTLKLLLEFLNKVIAFEHLNKMGLNSVAMIIAPNLFFNSSTKADMESVAKAVVFTDIMRMLIKYQNILWTVPGFMVTQIRYLYEAGSKSRDPKAVRKVIAKRMRDTANVPGSPGKSFIVGDITEVEDGCIVRIKAPTMEKRCMAMHVYANTTVADLITKFRWRRNSTNRHSEDDFLTPNYKSNLSKSDTSLDREGSKEYFLFEVGGNIGERRLDPLTNMLALIRANPNAEWILKC